MGPDGVDLMKGEVVGFGELMNKTIQNDNFIKTNIPVVQKETSVTTSTPNVSEVDEVVYCQVLNKTTKDDKIIKTIIPVVEKQVPVTASTPNVSEVVEVLNNHLLSEKNDNVEMATLKRDSVLVVAEIEDGEILSDEEQANDENTKNESDSEIEVVEIRKVSWKCICNFHRKVKILRYILH